MYKPVISEHTLDTVNLNMGSLPQYTINRDNTVPELPQRMSDGQQTNTDHNRPGSEIYQSINRQASLLG